jgi:hypothetical protein
MMLEADQRLAGVGEEAMPIDDLSTMREDRSLHPLIYLAYLGRRRGHARCALINLDRPRRPFLL